MKLFFQSPKLSADLEKIKKAGGSIEVAPSNTGGKTWIAEFKDPTAMG